MATHPVEYDCARASRFNYCPSTRDERSDVAVRTVSLECGEYHELNQANDHTISLHHEGEDVRVPSARIEFGSVSAMPKLSREYRHGLYALLSGETDTRNVYLPCSCWASTSREPGTMMRAMIMPIS